MIESDAESELSEGNSGDEQASPRDTKWIN